MSKTLITALGLVISLGVIALGFFLVGLPIFVQSFGVDAQTAVVANANAIYQAQVDSLSEQEENLDEISASVAGLRSQIPATGQFDDVFEVIGRAAAATQVQITTITAGEQVAFAPRTGPTEDRVVAIEPAPEATDGAAGDDATVTEEPGAAVVEAGPGGREQVEFAIQVVASDMGQVTAFLDALRDGPRLLNSVNVTSTQSGGVGFNVIISALTYVDAEG